MTPLNPVSFSKKCKDLSIEADNIIADKTLQKNHKQFCFRLNEHRDKCVLLMTLSFENEDNIYKKEFEQKIHIISQNDIYAIDDQIATMMVSSYIERLEQTKYLLAKTLNTIDFINEIQDPLPSAISDEGLYFKGQYYDAIFQLDKIINQAQHSLQLVDNYLNLDLLNFLSQKKSSILLQILTTSKNIAPLKLSLNGFQSQYQHLEIRESQSYHDRFLIIDDDITYHFGASLKDLGKKTFMFSKINEPIIKKAIRDDFASNWSKGTVLFT